MVYVNTDELHRPDPAQPGRLVFREVRCVGGAQPARIDASRGDPVGVRRDSEITAPPCPSMGRVVYSVVGTPTPLFPVQRKIGPVDNFDSETEVLQGDAGLDRLSNVLALYTKPSSAQYVTLRPASVRRTGWRSRHQSHHHPRLGFAWTIASSQHKVSWSYLWERTAKVNLQWK